MATDKAPEESDALDERHAKPRSIRVPDPLWEAVKAKAASEGRTATSVAIVAFIKYVGWQ